MLEKNKDYIEMLVSSTDCAFTQNALTQISVDGHVYTTYMDLPTPGELYIIISKEKFEKMQADDQYYRELAKQREENYNLLLKKTGFDTVESLFFYLTNFGKNDTLVDAIASYISERDKALEEREVMKKELDHEIDTWQKATGRISPEEAKQYIERLKGRLNKIHDCSVDW